MIGDGLKAGLFPLVIILLNIMTLFPCISGVEADIDFICCDMVDGTDGPLGEWPDFTPIGYITAPHPDYPQYQTHLYGDWGGIVGEEFIFLQEDKIKLLYHSYHETYMTERAHEYEILDNWTLGYNPVTKIKYMPLVKPGGPNPGPAWEHTDTPGYIQHPITGEHLIYNTVRPGTKYLHQEWDDLPGWEGSIQLATSETTPEIGVPFEQTYESTLVAEYWWEQGWNQNGVIKGGLSEPTPVWAPHLGTQGKVRLFYRGLHGSVGSYWNWRISYADSEDGKTDWVKNPVPTFDPSQPGNPAFQWTLPYPLGFSFRGAWQAHCTGDARADGVHMVLTVSNQNYAGGGHIAYYWSPDWGDTWIGHPDNPIIAPGQFPDGVPPEGFQRTPTLLIDEDYGRYVLAYNAGHDIDQYWKRRTYLAIASRPMNNPPLTPVITGPTSGAVNHEHSYTVTTTDQDGDDVYYLVDWGDENNTEWIGPYYSGDEAIVSHVWKSAGNYLVRAKSRDVYTLQSEWSEPLTIKIGNPPNNPIITGPTKLKPNEKKEFTFTSTDPDGDQIYYRIEWGDGTNTSWTGPFASGYQLKLAKTWDYKARFTIKCKAKDADGLESDHGILEISTPRTIIPKLKFLMLLKNHPDLYPIILKMLARIGQ